MIQSLPPGSQQNGSNHLTTDMQHSLGARRTRHVEPKLRSLLRSTIAASDAKPDD
jgi:hypothetical protein